MRFLIICVLTLAAAIQPARAQGHRSDPARAAELAASVHADLSCSACHREHRQAVEACGSCHQQAAERHAAGAHRGTPLSCVACHGSHAVQAATTPGARTSRPNIAALCGDCHANTAREANTGAHHVALQAGSPNAPTCVTCHRAHDVARAVPADKCGTCHASALLDHERSAHASTVACSTCHATHREPSGLAANGARTYVGSLARCADCHRDQLEDHTRGPHGEAARGGDPNAPACATCHGAHSAISDRDPASPLAPVRRGEVCGTCHLGANAVFATGAYHHDPSELGHRVVDWVRVMYGMMIVVVIAGMLFHNALDFRRRWVDRRKHRPASGERVARFTLVERIQHWTLAISFLTLLGTGFSFHFGWRPISMDPATWAAWRSGLHRGAAIVFMALSVVHVGWLALTRRGRMNLAALRPRIRSVTDAICFVACCLRLGPPSTADWRALVETIKYNLGRAPSRPAQGRFTYAEKMEYYALVWGGIVMVGTGLALCFVTPLLDRFPAWTAHLAGVIHFYEATLAGLAIIVWHFYSTMFRPDVFPLSRAMISGDIPSSEAAEEHPLEHAPSCPRCHRAPSQCQCTPDAVSSTKTPTT